MGARGSITMALYCQKDERLDHMFAGVFLDNKLSVGYVNRERYTQTVLEICTCKNCISSGNVETQSIQSACVLLFLDIPAGLHAKEAGVHSAKQNM